MRCIFCKNQSDNSTSVEHVVPESLGSKKIVLPKGFVCDKCNNYFSHKVESPVINHDSFKNIRAWYRVPNKKGKLPTVSGIIAGEDINISMKLDSKGKLDIQPEKETDREKVNETLRQISSGSDFNPLIFKLDITPPEYAMSRFLAKMGLEFLAYRFRDDKEMIEFIMDSDHYDSIRNFARLGGKPTKWPFSSRRIFPIETFMSHPQTGESVMFGFGYDLLLNHRKETYFIFLYYGVEFVINLGGPSIKGYEEWLRINNNISPIIERNGGQLVKKDKDNQSIYTIVGSYSSANGIMFDKKLIKKFSV